MAINVKELLCAGLSDDQYQRVRTRAYNYLERRGLKIDESDAEGFDKLVVYALRGNIMATVKTESGPVSNVLILLASENLEGLLKFRDNFGKALDKAWHGLK